MPEPQWITSSIIEVGRKVVVLTGEYKGSIGTVVSYNRSNIGSHPVVRIKRLPTPDPWRTGAEAETEVVFKTEALGLLWDGTQAGLLALEPKCRKFPPGTKVWVERAPGMRREAGIIINIDGESAFVHFIRSDTRGITALDLLYEFTPANAQSRATPPAPSRSKARPRGFINPLKAEPPD